MSVLLIIVIAGLVIGVLAGIQEERERTRERKLIELQIRDYERRNQGV